MERNGLNVTTVLTVVLGLVASGFAAEWVT